MNHILSFKDTQATRVELSGGKGANLALLTQQGFPVPQGFIVTANTYREFANTARQLLAQVNSWRFDDPAFVRAASADVRKKLAHLPLPNALADEVTEHLRQFPTNQSFSVRSSSTLEDLASAAFAGQHETYLNISEPDAILARIQDCWISLWQDRAIAYRHQQHFDHSSAAMAVVVQVMAPCDTAGVAFSINPVSGDMGEVCVDANLGLGESVVSGACPVDHWTIDRATRKVRHASIARKQSKVVGVTGGTREVQLPANEALQPCLSTEQLTELADLVLRVESNYGFPQDIEWGFAEGHLYLLQSRPITSIPPRWTRDESAERFPNVISPLTWDFVEKGFHQSLRHSLQLMGLPPFNGKWFGMHGHYIYGNQNAVDLYARRSPVKITSLDTLPELIPQLRSRFRWVLDLPVTWSRDLDSYLIRLGEFMTEPLGPKSLAELWNFVLEVNEHGTNYFLPNIAISITHGTLYTLLHHLVRLAIPGDKADRLFDELMACETKTGQINRELFDMATQIRAIPKLETAILNRPSRDILDEGLLDPHTQLASDFRRFLRNHGHREVDFDAYIPTWTECPWIVLDNLRLILQTPMSPTPTEKEREQRLQAQHAEFVLFQHLPEHLHFFFSELIRLARAYTSLDDLEHYQTTRLTLALRRGLHELGRRLTNQEILKEPMDIFFGHRHEIEKAIETDTSEAWQLLSTQVSKHKHEYLQAKSQPPAWILGQDEDKASETTETSSQLTGLAGSPGTAEGPVFIIRSPDDFARFPRGSVLVARTTNPTWTPLFYSAAAVVTESGGPLSHGAVTAREMGIPAVMSAKNVLSLLKNGQKVRVNGSKATVEIIDSQIPSNP